MAVKSHITDSGSGISAAIVDSAEENALVVATRPLKTFMRQTIFATNDTYGREMAQDGAFGGAPLLLHNGVDDVAWTFSEPVGAKWTADANDQFFAGAASMKSDNSNVGDIMQIINNVGPGDDLDMTGNRVALTTWIRVGSDWIAGDSFSIYAHIDGAQVGNKVLLEDYFNFDNFDIWQFINIPLTDMSLESATLDAFRIENEARVGAKSPKFWVDDITLQESGAPIDFTIKPDLGTWFYIKAFQTTFVDAVSADNADSTMPQLSYNKILDVTPTAGYVYRRYTAGEDDPVEETRITNLMDLLSLPCAEISNHISDGTNTLITITTVCPESVEIILKAEELDRIVYSVEDSFDNLLFFRISAQGYTEERN